MPQRNRASANAIAADPPTVAVAYRPRNVANAPDIKSAIRARSEERNDDPQVRAWLENHFFRWLIGSFEPAVRVTSVAHYAELAGGPDKVPAWFVKRHGAEAAAMPSDCHHINPEHPLLHAQETRLVEFLNARRGTRLAEKLQRITCFMALSMWEREHVRMQARRGKGWVPSSGLALEQRLVTPNGTLFEFMGQSEHLREEMAYESYHMQHCLGQFADRKRLNGGYGEQYASSAERGELRLFTLRGPGNLPHVTMSIRVRNGGSFEIDQIKGKQNRPPVRKYADDVLQFLQWLVPAGDRHADCERMGLVFERPAGEAIGGRWKFVTDIHDPEFLVNVLAVNLHLTRHFEQVPPTLQWLMLATQPERLVELKQVDATVRTAAATVITGHWSGPAQDAPLQVDGIALNSAAHWLAAQPEEAWG